MRRRVSSLSGLFEAMRDFFYQESYCDKLGLLQRVDARPKLLASAALVVTAVLAQTPWALIPILATLLLLSALSKIPIRVLVWRTTFFIPFFAAIIALPIAFTTPGSSLALLPTPWGVLEATKEGVCRATAFILRVWICVYALVLLTLTTRFVDIIRALYWLGLPKAFVSMTAVTYRYIFLLLDEARRMALAREARSPTKPRRISKRYLKDLGGILAALFIRSYERGERVYLAMKARGYSSAGFHANLAPIPNRDWLLFAAALCTCAASLLLDFFEFLAIGWCV